jgi:hypothetical protein
VLFPVEFRSIMEPLIAIKYAGNTVVPGYVREMVEELPD